MAARLGEMLSLAVSVSWTVTALFGDLAGKRLGPMPVNVLRMGLATLFLGIILLAALGTPWPLYADSGTWLWLILSALVGYVFGDFCLFSAYSLIGARFGQLFMTLAPPIAAVAGWFLLGESLSWKSWLAMAVTLSGIALSILSRGSDRHLHFSLPLKGILFGLGAGFGQGFGLVLSKIGIQHYESALPPDAPQRMMVMMPFAATLIRAIAGGFGFLALMALRGNLRKLQIYRKEPRGVVYTALTTLFGPVIGVSLSLMAVRYAEAGIASTLMALTPVLILLPYALLYHQKIRLRELVGVTISMLGVAMFFLL